jgi:uncharacterized protein YeaO (DUF488 family)
MIYLKRAHEKPSPEDGVRVLVERFWPRDLDEKHAKLDLWLQEVAPIAELHQAFGEDPDPGRWEEFQRLHRDELKDKHKAVKRLRKESLGCTVTLVHAARHPDRSPAVVLKRFLEEAAGSPEDA